MLKIGTDITQISRIVRLREKYGAKFLCKILRKSEREIFVRDESIAGAYAAKEALSKALGVGIGAKFSFKDAKIYKDKFGAPNFKFTKKLKKKFRIKASSLSITHDNGVAIAIVAINLKTH
ncbi:holo-ACP synthase [Campylobacter sp. JMF_01 NE2]|uniref:holo-ACP synthase n=1 Tax=unclassified Campylobacter TaxID=2593542 RepID=UPI0022E9BF8C|nr:MULTISPECIES: holo-ACP synthase [unclassified Campylobacter]MDA3050203.1 holo-ACP synthase [Campylobacter sp. JMF_15 NE4]MDA3051634.1 holo-ACP synthase [Campylobacter sp. JMF_02 ED1]MDA3051879.1 holo-ACP synthase [Campylobacter sp. JMF_03 NE3]MDA3060438.1 holo-ACP synthase [Campylobacter sp. VBCF_02 NA5]MDA3066213.1 holo-ACP synthase [Campylobacter sp. JMF_01 NE2]